MTISFDHEVLDGTPYTRFLNRLTELIENAYFLNEMLILLDNILKQIIYSPQLRV